MKFRINPPKITIPKDKLKSIKLPNIKTPEFLKSPSLLLGTTVGAALGIIIMVAVSGSVSQTLNMLGTIPPMTIMNLIPLILVAAAILGILVTTLKLAEIGDDY